MTIYAVVVFGISAVYVLAACIAGAMLGELVMQAGRRLPGNPDRLERPC